jgi:phage-related protein
LPEGTEVELLPACPQDVRDEVGYALYLAQIGAKYEGAKPLKGVGAGVLEVIADHRGDTYRAVYTVRFAERVFQKKSKKGIATPQSEIDLVRQRLKRAAELDRSGSTEMATKKDYVLGSGNVFADLGYARPEEAAAKAELAHTDHDRLPPVMTVRLS